MSLDSARKGEKFPEMAAPPQHPVFTPRSSNPQTTWGRAGIPESGWSLSTEMNVNCRAP